MNASGSTVSEQEVSHLHGWQPGWAAGVRDRCSDYHAAHAFVFDSDAGGGRTRRDLKRNGTLLASFLVRRDGVYESTSWTTARFEEG